MLKYCSVSRCFLKEYLNSQESYDHHCYLGLLFDVPYITFVRTLKAVEPSPPATELRELSDNT